jgi:CHAT domain-containing protein
MRRRIDWSSLPALSFSLFLSLGGSAIALGQAQPCQGCIPPSSGIPTSQPPANNPATPSYPGSSPSAGPQASPYGWTAPVPNRISISQSGQVYFHYNNPGFPGPPGGVPVSGINPYQTFNGMNGMPHWSTMGGNLANMAWTYYSTPSNYSYNRIYSPFPFGSSQSPIPVASVYNPVTGTQVGATNINGMTTSLNSLNYTSLTYRNLNTPTYTPSTSFTTSGFNSNYFNNFNQNTYSTQTSNSSYRSQQAPGANPLSALYRATNDVFGQGRSLANIGRDQLSAGELKEALKTFERAIPLSRAAADKIGEAVTHATVAQTYLSMGEGRQALGHFEQAYQAAREANDVRLQSLTLRGAGAAHLASGEADLALDAYRRARAMASIANDTVAEAEILASMGWVYQFSGELQQAMARYQEALALVVKSGNRATEVKTRVGIGLLYQSLGEPEKSFDHYRKAAEIAAVTPEVSNAEYAGIFTSAGDAYLAMGKGKKALDCYQLALPMMKRAGNKVGEAGALASLGRTYSSLGWLHTALDYYSQALRLMREEGNRAGEAGALAGIGETYFWAGLRGTRLVPPAVPLQSEEVSGQAVTFVSLKGSATPYDIGSGDFPKAMKQALECYQKTLAVMNSLGNRVGKVGILTNIGLVYDSWNKPEQALDYYHKSIEVLESMRTSARLEEFRTSLAQQSAVVYQRAILLSLRLKRRQEAFDLSERARARTFLDQLGNARIDLRKDMADQSVLQEQKLRQELSYLEQQFVEERAKPAPQLNKELIQSLETRLTGKQKEYEGLLTHLKLTNPKYASLISVDPLTLSRAQNLLDEETTLVSYFVTAEKTLAFVTTRESSQVVELPVQQQELEKAVTLFRDFPSLDDAPPNLRQLHKWLIAPIKSHLKTPYVGIIPHGTLHNLPFAALTDGKRYLGDNHKLFYLPSISALRYIRQNQKSGGGRLLALAYGEGEGLPFLRYANDEAQAVAKLYGANARIGGAATAAAFRASAGDYDILHLVSHYQPNTITPLFSSLILAPGEDASGLLELHEVYGMELKKADLVVLSVCQSNSGARSRGDDITGLSRAFLYAGAPTVISSLWNVDDRATSELMTSFYKRLREGMSKAAALRAAQAETRAKPEYSHPYYWAGFVLIGQPGTTSAPNSGPAVEASGETGPGSFKN